MTDVRSAAGASVRFAAKYPWAIVPDRPRAEPRPASVPEGASRWLRSERTQRRCRPSAQATRLGWTVRSPIAVQMAPVPQIEVDAEPDDLSELAAALPDRALWRREASYLAIDRRSWIGLHQARFGEAWEAMFVPNGEGTLEWHLGWTVDIPPTHALLVLPEPASPVTALTGLLDAASLGRIGRQRGMSIAIHPRRATIQRGDPVARLVLLHPDSLTGDS